MTSCAELLDNVNPEGHLVQLYGKDDRLAHQEHQPIHG